MHLDRSLDAAIVGVMQVGVPAADMRDHSAIFLFQPFEQLVGGVDRLGGCLSLDQEVRRASDGPALAPEEDVAVATHAGVARPFVAGKTNKLTGPVELRSQAV